MENKSSRILGIPLPIIFLVLAILLPMAAGFTINYQKQQEVVRSVDQLINEMKKPEVAPTEAVMPSPVASESAKPTAKPKKADKVELPIAENPEASPLTE